MKIKIIKIIGEPQYNNCIGKIIYIEKNTGRLYVQINNKTLILLPGHDTWEEIEDEK